MPWLRWLAAISAVLTADIALIAGAAPAHVSTVSCRESCADTCIDVSATGQVTGWARVDTASISGDAYFTAANVYVVQCRGDLTGCTSKFAAGSNHGAHVNIVSTGNPGPTVTSTRPGSWRSIDSAPPWPAFSYC